MGEVISEYKILREVIFQVLEKNQPMKASERDIILDSIEQAVNDAAVKFAEVHAEIQKKFIDTLTHDLKNPIAAAMMNANLLQKSTLNHAQGRQAKRLVSSLNRVTGMVHDLLDAGRVRAGELIALEFVNTDLRMVLEEVVSEMRELHSNSIVLTTDQTVQGFWGAQGLRRAFENLLGNAVKYGDEKFPIQVSL
ncbi:MAG: HAMP domain-containing histidine kinase [Proteobacteria bacterium]|nr:MAG: HAMP domain-containing histidine kinase [Pseudomonadota bacterium]